MQSLQDASSNWWKPGNPPGAHDQRRLKFNWVKTTTLLLLDYENRCVCVCVCVCPYLMREYDRMISQSCFSFILVFSVGWSVSKASWHDRIEKADGWPLANQLSVSNERCQARDLSTDQIRELDPMCLTACDRPESMQSARATGEVSAGQSGTKNHTGGFLQSLQIGNRWCGDAGKACELFTEAE